MLEQIAKTAHAIHRAFCVENGIPTQPQWDDVGNEHRDVVFKTIRHILNGDISSVDDSHKKFVESKTKQGWVFGEEYDLKNKINPRLVEFENLTLEQRTKERLFFECVISFMDSKQNGLMSHIKPKRPDVKDYDFQPYGYINALTHYTDSLEGYIETIETKTQ